MRISTSQMFNASTNKISEGQSNLAKLQAQIATGKRIQSPSDDPVGASSVVQIEQSLSVSKQFDTNISNAKNTMAFSENVLQQINDVLKNAHESLIKAGNGGFSDADRKSVAEDMDGQLKQLLGLINTKDEAGRYLFSGFVDDIAPYSSANSVYAGDNGERDLQIGPNRFITTSVSGGAVFERVPTISGNFSVANASSNTGSGVITATDTYSDTQTNPQTPYRIRFTTATTYNIEDMTNPASPVVVGAANQTYSAGATITIDGKNVVLNGTPANNDVFNITPTTNKSTLKTLQDAVTLLRTPIGVNNAAAKESLRLGLAQSIGNIQLASDSVLVAQTTLGSGLRELDMALDSNGETQLQYQTRIGELQDLDYAQAISELTKQQMILQAAQQSFVKISGKSLFDMIG